MLAAIAQDEVLHAELHIDDAAAVVLEIEQFRGVGMAVVHFLAHGEHLVAQLGRVTRQAEDVAADSFEGLTDAGIAADETRARDRLVFPGPGVRHLVVAESLGRTH